jgi:glycosyltransferase involved in cell wall biosynthesis
MAGLTADPRAAGFPRVTFGIIVLNGEPFTRYCLRGLYPYAHEIIVVEGGHEDARAVTTPDGHSVDGTLEVLARFKAEEDPLDKVQIVTRDGFWTKADERGRHRTHQSRAYAERATGDYLWQVDIDEFYQPAQMESVLRMLAHDPSISAVSFNLVAFWGGLDYVHDGWYWMRGGRQCHRVFRWGPGYQYVTHEPPIIHDDLGRDVRQLHWVSGDEMESRGVRMYHYDQVFPHQVTQKAAIYRFEKPKVCAEVEKWAEESYMQLGHPFHVERHFWLPSWIDRYQSDHPPEVRRMMSDIESGRLAVERRRTDDIERLLRSPLYRAERRLVRAAEPVDRARRWATLQAVRASHVPRKMARAVGPREREGSRRRDAAVQPAEGSGEGLVTMADAAGAEARPPSVLIMVDFGFPYGTGGSSRAFNYARGLQSAGARVKVACVEPSEGRNRQCNKEVRGSYRGVPFEYTCGRTTRPTGRIRRRILKLTKWGRYLGAVRQCADAWGGLDAILVYTRSVPWIATAWVACRMVGATLLHEDCELPFVWQTHRTGVSVRRLIYERGAFKAFDGCVVISTYLGSYCRRRLRPSAGTLLVPILVQVDDGAGMPDEKGRLEAGEGDDGPIVYAGSLDHPELLDLFTAFSLIADEFPATRLEILGAAKRDATMPTLRARLAQLNLEDRVDLPGHVPREQLLTRFGAARLLALPRPEGAFSRAGLPTKVAEYLASGKPVVVTAVGDLPLYLRDGVDAYLAAPGYPALFAGRLRDALLDPRAAAVGEQGRATAREKFDPALHGARILEFIAGLRAGGGRAGDAGATSGPGEPPPAYASAHSAGAGA